MAEGKGQISEDLLQARVDATSLPSTSSPLLRDKREGNMDATPPSHNVNNNAQNNERVEMVELQGAATDSAAVAAPSTCRKMKLIAITLAALVVVAFAVRIGFFVYQQLHRTLPRPAIRILTTPETTTGDEFTSNSDVTSNTELSVIPTIPEGRNADENEWPWQVLIMKKSYSMAATLNRNKIKSGGSIINGVWILTTATLVYDGNVDHLAVFAGISKQPYANERVMDSVEAYAIGNYFKHPNYSIKTLHNDIGLIKLGAKLDSQMMEVQGKENGLTFKTGIRPVCLPCTRNCPIKDFGGECEMQENYLLAFNTTVVATGFVDVGVSYGMAYYGFNPAKHIQERFFKIEDKNTCKRGIEKMKNLTKGLLSDFMYTENRICCSSRKPGKINGTCGRKGGGPLVEKVNYDVGENNTVVNESFWVQIGIASFGFGCSSEIPGYFTNVAKYIPWINSTTDGIF